MVIKNPRKGGNRNVGQTTPVTDEDIALYNAAMTLERKPVYKAMLKTRDPETMSSGSSLAGYLSPDEIKKRNDARIKALQKQQSSSVAAAKAAADMAWEREKRSWERQDRTWTVADRERQARLAEEERQREAAALARKGQAFRGIADLYKTQGEESYQEALKNIAAAYGGEEEAVTSARKRQLDALTRALAESRGQIGSAEQQALSSLISPTAYSNLPLVNLAPQQQVLQAALAAEGAGPSAEQTAEQNYAQQLAAQFNELARRSAEQLNVGEQNYLTALRNALTGGALAARTGLEQRGTAITGGIEEQYAAAVRELARQRAEAQAQADAERRAAMLRAAEAAAEAEGYSPSSGAGKGKGEDADGAEGDTQEDVPLTPQQLEDLRRKLELARLAAIPQQLAQPTLGMFGME